MTTPTLPALTTTDLPLTSAMVGASIAFPRFLKVLNESIAAGAVANVTHTARGYRMHSFIADSQPAKILPQTDRICSEKSA